MSFISFMSFISTETMGDNYYGSQVLVKMAQLQIFSSFKTKSGLIAKLVYLYIQILALNTVYLSAP